MISFLVQCMFKDVYARNRYHCLVLIGLVVEEMCIFFLMETGYIVWGILSSYGGY